MPCSAIDGRSTLMYGPVMWRLSVTAYAGHMCRRSGGRSSEADARITVRIFGEPGGIGAWNAKVREAAMNKVQS